VILAAMICLNNFRISVIDNYGRLHSFAENLFQFHDGTIKSFADSIPNNNLILSYTI